MRRLNRIRRIAKATWTVGKNTTLQEWLHAPIVLRITMDRPTRPAVAALTALALLAGTALTAGMGWIRPAGPVSTTEGIAVSIGTITTGLVLLFVIEKYASTTRRSGGQRVQATSPQDAVKTSTRKEAEQTTRQGGATPEKTR